MKIYVEENGINVNKFDVFSDFKTAINYRAKKKEDGPEFVSYNRDGFVAFARQILGMFWGINEADTVKELTSEGYSSVLVASDERYMGSFIVPKVDGEKKGDIKFFPFSSILEDVQDMSEEEFKKAYRCAKEEIDENYGVLFFLENGDYVIMSGDEYKDLDELLSEFNISITIL